MTTESTWLRNDSGENDSGENDSGENDSGKATLSPSRRPREHRSTELGVIVIGQRMQRAAGIAVIRGAVHHRQRARIERGELADVGRGRRAKAGVVKQPLRLDRGAHDVLV